MLVYVYTGLEMETNYYIVLTQMLGADRSISSVVEVLIKIN